jgi:hypothetical protein
MIHVSNKLPPGYLWTIEHTSIKWNDNRVIRHLPFGAIIFDVVKKGLYHNVYYASSLDIDYSKTANIEVVFFLNSSDINSPISTEKVDVHHMNVAVFTSSHKVSNLWLETGKNIIVPTEVVYGKGTNKTENERPMCETTGIHSWDFNRKCMACGIKEDDIEYETTS